MGRTWGGVKRWDERKVDMGGLDFPCGLDRGWRERVIAWVWWSSFPGTCRAVCHVLACLLGFRPLEIKFGTYIVARTHRHFQGQACFALLVPKVILSLQKEEKKKRMHR